MSRPRRGRIAFYAWGNTGTHFDDLSVQQLFGSVPPIISAVSASPTTLTDLETSQLSVTATDPDSGPSPLSYSWSVPPGAGSVDDPTSATPVYTPADVTSSQPVTLSVSVSDGESSIPGTVEVTVSDGAAVPPLLEENFDAGVLTDWTVVDESTQYSPAAWTATSGALVQTSDAYTLPTDRNTLDKLGTYAWYPAGLSWTDYRLTHTLHSQDNDALGVMFRYQDADNYYRFSWDRQRAYRRLVKRVNGVTTLLVEDSVTYVSGQTYAVEIAAQGSSLAVLINGTPVLSATDGDLASGSIAFYSWANLNSTFDDVLVEVP